MTPTVIVLSCCYVFSLSAVVAGAYDSSHKAPSLRGNRNLIQTPPDIWTLPPQWTTPCPPHPPLDDPRCGSNNFIIIDPTPSPTPAPTPKPTPAPTQAPALIPEPECIAHSDCVGGLCLQDKTCSPCGNGSSKKIMNDFAFCYFEKGGLTFDLAKQKCQALGLRLVEFGGNQEKYDALSQHAGHDYTWLGLTCQVQIDASCDTNYSAWTWLRDGTTYNGSGMQIGNDLTLVGGGPGEYCAHWWSGAAKVGPQNCGDSKHYGALCEAASQ